jgi:excisionase family DNA binding protein
MKQLIDLSDDTTRGLRTSSATNGAPQRTENPPRLLLTVEEAAERVGICRSNMFKLIRQGDVESVKVGRLRRVTPAALEDFVKRLSLRQESVA